MTHEEKLYVKLMIKNAYMIGRYKGMEEDATKPYYPKIQYQQELEFIMKHQVISDEGIEYIND